MESVLLIRADDLVLAHVTWSGMRVRRGGPAGDTPVLVVDASGGQLRLTLPPQHIAEQATRSASGDATPSPVHIGGREIWVWGSMLSGPSWLEFAIPGPAEIPLSVEGLLGATNGLELAGGTRVELPWRLPLRPVVGDGEQVVAAHLARPPVQTDTVPVWRTSVHTLGLRNELATVPANERSGRRPVRLVAIDDGTADANDPPFRIPLQREHRRDIVRLSNAGDPAGGGPAVATRLELSPLGGTLRVTGRWPAMEWDHDAVLGRDMRVRTLVRGFLYPLGHRAEYLEISVREPDARPLAGGAASLHFVNRLTVVEPVRQPSTDARARRAFPFDEVQITTTEYAELRESPGWQTFTMPDGRSIDGYFTPQRPNGDPVHFPVSCAAEGGDVRFELPMVFVKDLGLDAAAGARLAADVRDFYQPATVPIPPTRLDLVRASPRLDGDVHEVSSLKVSGSHIASSPVAADYRPCLDELDVALPALRTLLGKEVTRTVAFTDDFLDRGESAAAFMKLADGKTIDVSFVGRSDRSGGLAAPRYVANAISRTLGPVKIHEAAPEAPTALIRAPTQLFEPDATLLGFRLRDLVGAIDQPPAITSLLQPGRPPSVAMRWSDIKLATFGAFVDRGGRARLDLDVVSTATETRTACTVRGFALRFPLLELSFEQLTYLRRTGTPGAPGRGVDEVTELGIVGLEARLLGVLELLDGISGAVSVAAAGPTVEASPRGITANYVLPLPAIGAGVFVMRNVMLRVGVDVPFAGESPEVTLGFASRESPFVLTVLAFGGGGYIELVANHRGLRHLDVAFEFGALVVVDFVVARGEAHVLGGVRVVLEAEQGEAAISGYLRVGGALEILGLVSVSVELCIELTYQTTTNALVGRATLVLEIDLVFWEESVELDSGEWRLAGGRASRSRLERAADRAVPPADAAFDRWRDYRRSFAPDPASVST